MREHTNGTMRVMYRTGRMIGGAALVLVGCWAGCASYRAAPLDPGKGQAELVRRSLADPAMLEWVRAHQAAEGGATTEGTGPASQPATRGARWDLEGLALVAMYYHPDLDAARAHLAAVRAGEITAGQSPNPTVGYAPQIAQNPGGASPWVMGLTLDWPIETAGKRGDRIGQARALTDAARLDLAETAWQLRSRVRSALAEYLLDARAQGLLENEVALRSSYVGLLEARLQAGEIARPEVDTAQVDLLTARQALRAMQGQVGSARAKLAAGLGMTEAGLGDAQFGWGEYGGLETFAALGEAQMQMLQDAGLRNRLDVLRSLAEYAAAEWALRLEVAKQYPDVVISPGYEYDQGEHKWGLGVSLELPVMNHNQGPIAEARAHRTELAARFLALQGQVIGELEAAEADYRGALGELAEAEAALAATGKEVDAARQRLNAGGEDRLTLTGLEVQYAVAARLRLEAVRKAEAARGALEDAIERPLPDWPPPPTTRAAPQPATTTKAEVP